MRQLIISLSGKIIKPNTLRQRCELGYSLVTLVTEADISAEAAEVIPGNQPASLTIISPLCLIQLTMSAAREDVALTQPQLGRGRRRNCETGLHDLVNKNRDYGEQSVRGGRRDQTSLTRQPFKIALSGAVTPPVSRGAPPARLDNVVLLVLIPAPQTNAEHLRETPNRSGT